MPIDMPLWNLVQENKAAVVAALIARFDPQPGQRISDLFSRRRVLQLAVRILARPAAGQGRLRHRILAAAGFRCAAARRRRLPADEKLPPGDRGPACTARFSRCDRPRADSDRPRRSQSPEPVSVWDCNRPQCARQEPFQRSRQHALVSCGFRPTRSVLSRLANPGSRRCGPSQRGSERLRRLCGRRHLSRARGYVRPDQRQQHQAVEGRVRGPAPAHEVAAIGRPLRHGGPFALPRPQPASADRQ